MCELLANPGAAVSGIGDATPEFGWIVNSTLTNDVQTAYQIMVATSVTLLDMDTPDRWDSGKVASDNSVCVSYAGLPLSVSQSYFWKVRTWNKLDQSSDWSTAQEFKTASSFSVYSTARYKQVTTEVKPISVTKIENGHYLADFGKAAFGYLRWSIPKTLLRVGTADSTIFKMSRSDSGSSPFGQTIELHLGEKLSNGYVDRSPAGSIRYYYKALVLDGSSSYDIHVGKSNWMPAELGNIGTFRYVEFINSPFPISVADLTLFFVHYPFDDSAASFQCNNQTLNDIWQLCYYSMKDTSWCGIFVDGDRERKPYEADAYINQLGYYCVDREFSIARYSHEYLMSHPTWPTEWRQHSILMAWADYLYTGNIESLAHYYVQLKNDKLMVTADSARASDGLINPATTDITDWPSGERDGFSFQSYNAVVNAFYYHTLTLMKQIAEALGNIADAADFQIEADRIYNSFQSVFFNNATSLYVDGEGTTHSSLHTNMWALAFGLVPDGKKGPVVEFVKSRQRAGTNPGRVACSVYGAQYLLEALYLTDQEDAALEIMTNITHTSWVNMINEGSTVSMEAWGIAYKSNQDWNHAWGAAPANIIPRFTAGIRPLEPGFAKALIHPQPGSLSQFSIRVPTIRGPILLSMNKQPNNCTFDLTIPANMTARFVLPKHCDSFSQISLDGNLIVPQQHGTERYIDPVGSGAHILFIK
jgi:hypothetical protein